MEPPAVEPVLDPAVPVALPPPIEPEADEPAPPPIVAFARMNSPPVLPDADEVALPVLLDAADDPLPDCRQPVSVTFWLRDELPDCVPIDPDEDPVEPVVPDCPEDPEDPPDCDPVCPAGGVADPPDCEPDAPPDWAETPTASAADNIVPKINCRLIQTSWVTGVRSRSKHTQCKSKAQIGCSFGGKIEGAAAPT